MAKAELHPASQKEQTASAPSAVHTFMRQWRKIVAGAVMLGAVGTVGVTTYQRSVGSRHTMPSQNEAEKNAMLYRQEMGHLLLLSDNYGQGYYPGLFPRQLSVEDRRRELDSCYVNIMLNVRKYPGAEDECSRQREQATDAYIAAREHLGSLTDDQR